MNGRPEPNVFFGKLMLFGEYSILLGSSALSIPYFQFEARLKFINDVVSATESELKSNQKIRELVENYEKEADFFCNVLDLERLKRDAAKGLFLESAIPQGYGMGSSGALCAALYHAYALEAILPWLEVDQKKSDSLKSILAAMESLFHGKSSGFDPVSIYLQQPLYQNQQGTLASPDSQLFLPGDKGQLFLIDTGIVEKTSPLVKVFLNRFLPGKEDNKMGKDFCNLNNRCISALLEGDPDSFWKVIPEFSAFQFSYLTEMIPEKMKAIWSAGIESHLFSLKLCGAGGGGYLLGFAENPSLAFSFIRANGFEIIPVVYSPS